MEKASGHRRGPAEARASVSWFDRPAWWIYCLGSFKMQSEICFISCDRDDSVVSVKSGNPVTAPLSSLAPAPASRGRLHGDGQKEPLPARGLQESAPPGLVDAAAQRR